MRIHALGAGVLLALSLPAQDPTLAAGPQAAFQRLQEQSGNQWVAQWHAATGTPSVIYGPGLPLADWRANSLDEARRQAQLLLQQYATLLGTGASDFHEEIGARMGRTWSLTYAQSFRGLPVIEGRIDFRIHMRGAVSMLGSRAFPIPADFDTGPALGDELATAIAIEAFSPQAAGAAVRPGAAQLCIWGDIDAPQLAPVFLAWEVPVRSLGADGAMGRYYVDAKTGAVLHYRNDRHECGYASCRNAAHARFESIAAAPTPAPAAAASTAAPLPLPVATTVTLMAWTRTGNDGQSALVNTPLRNIVVNVPGVGTRTTDANGQFSIDIAAPVVININGLDGTHHALIAGSSAPSASVQVDPGVPATIQLLSAAATSDQAAHTTAAYWIDLVNEWSRSILGNTAQLNTADNIAVNVNVNNNCNASYGGNTTNFFLAGNGCANTAFSTVVAHEWGHGLDDRYGGISNTTGDGLSEGWGDIIGMYLVDSSLLGSGFEIPGVPLRNGVNSRTYPQTGQGVHTAGQVWMGFAWDLRTRLRTAFGTPQAIAISNDIVIGSIVANATNQTNAVLQVFLADDDDANLLNGTPHYAQLSGAAIAKNLPYPEVVVGTLAHQGLADTDQRLTPREVLLTATPLTGSWNDVRVIFNKGTGPVLRRMQPTATPNVYRALLAGVGSGTMTYYFEAVHNSGAVVRLPRSGTYLYVVDTFQPFFGEGFENGAPGWTNGQIATQNDWQIGAPAGRSGTSSGIAWADPGFAPRGAFCIGNDLGNPIGATNWNGSYAANAQNFLRSPVIDCTGRTGVRLRFKRWLSVEDAGFDQASILVNGVQVWVNPNGANLVDTNWSNFELAIPSADNNPSVQIEWRLVADNGVQLGGWNLDDVQLGTLTAPPLGAELELLPEQAVQGSTVTMRIQTQAPNLPWLLGIGDTPGPTPVPGFPTFALGGNLALIGGATNAIGASFSTFPAPNVPSALGTLTYTQVLTIDAAATQFVVSNPFVSFFTQN
ncbi:MAG: hypothetical protein JNL08_09490 [Planctomycetes bacterium]|nr:hypothetical protein [Planctomycetota bacterium]